MGEEGTVMSDEAMREQKAIRTFLLVRAVRALIRSRETPVWRPWDRIKAAWVAGACADAAHAIERGEHYAEQAEWLSPLVEPSTPIPTPNTPGEE